MDALRAAGVPGINYWFTNMYHFINQWDHVKNLDAAARSGMSTAQFGVSESAGTHPPLPGFDSLFA